MCKLLHFWGDYYLVDENIKKKTEQGSMLEVQFEKQYAFFKLKNQCWEEGLFAGEA